MMIQSETELEALAEGTEIRVIGAGAGTRTWRRVANGFMSETDVLGTRFFVGFVAEGRVQTIDPYVPSAPGDWWQHRRITYLHVCTNADGTHMVASWNNSAWRSCTQVPPNYFQRYRTTFTRLGGAPEGLLVPPVALGEIVSRMAAPAKPPKPTTKIEYTVTMTGAQRPSDDVVRTMLRLPSNATVTPPNLAFRFEYTFTEEGNPDDGCQCQTVFDRNKAMARLPGEVTITGITVQCPSGRGVRL